MAKLKNRFKYLLTLVVPFLGTALIAQDAPAPKSGGNAEEAKGTLSAGAIAAAVRPGVHSSRWPNTGCAHSS